MRMLCTQLHVVLIDHDPMQLMVVMMVIMTVIVVMMVMGIMVMAVIVMVMRHAGDRRHRLDRLQRTDGTVASWKDIASGTYDTTILSRAADLIAFAGPVTVVVVATISIEPASHAPPTGRGTPRRSVVPVAGHRGAAGFPYVAPDGIVSTATLGLRIATVWTGPPQSSVPSVRFRSAALTFSWLVVVVKAQLSSVARL